MKRAMIMLVAAVLLPHRLAAQIEIRTRSVPIIGTVLPPPPVAITTTALKFTGTRFTPKSFTAGKLVFSGWRWMPVTYKTTGLVFTGMRKK